MTNFPEWKRYKVAYRPITKEKKGEEKTYYPHFISIPKTDKNLH